MTRCRLVLAVLLSCAAAVPLQGAEPIRVLFDTDANNEMDDQYALAYLLFNDEVFEVEGLTVNRTRHGGGIDQHAAEAERIVRLAGEKVPVTKGASGTFDEIKDQVTRPTFDGHEAVDLIIERAHAKSDRKLVLLPVGKLTNIALALKKDPSIAQKVRIVWLGSNYPEPGEYNQENDEPALSYVLDSNAPFEIALVRYGKPSGTDAVTTTVDEVRKKLPGKGPTIPEPVAGRHGGTFKTFGDYAVELFENMPGKPKRRALFDMAAVAIVKNPEWAQSKQVPAPALVNGRWVERPQNPRTITLWMNFDRDAIMNDFYEEVEEETVGAR